MENYGLVGEAYTKALLKRGKTVLLKLISESMSKFYERYGITFTGPERYWETNLVLLDVGLRIAEEEGLIAFNPALGIQWAVDGTNSLRSSVEDNKTNGFKLVNEYLNEVAADAVIVMHTAGMPSSMDQTRMPRGEIKVRFDKYRSDMNSSFTHGTVMLVQKYFKQWVSSRGYDYNTLRKEMSDAGIDATPAKKRCWMGRNTGLKAGQQNVFGINLNHPEYIGYLEDTPITPQDATLGQLAEVK